MGGNGRLGLWIAWGVFSLSLFFPRSAQAVEQHPCSENVGFGPIDVQGQSFYQMLHLNPTPAAPSTLPARRWEARFSSTWVNDWALSKGHYLVDSETLQGTGRLDHAFTDWFQIGIEMSFLLRGGGTLDRPIEGFHRLFGLSNMDREKFPRNQQLIEFHRKDGTTFVFDRSGIDLEDTVLSSQYTLTCGGSRLPAAALNLSVSLPTGRREALSGTGGSDVALALLLAKRFGAFYFYINGGYIWLGNRDFVGIPLKANRWTASSGVEYHPWQGTALILQNMVNSGIARDDVELSQFSDEVNFGIEHALSRRWFFQFALIENLFHFKNSPDFGIHVGTYYRF